jgi:hypothetical protein
MDSELLYEDSDLFYAEEYGLDSIHESRAERGPDIEDFDELQEDVEHENYEKNNGRGHHRHRRRLYRDDKQPFVLEVSFITSLDLQDRFSIHVWGVIVTNCFEILLFHHEYRLMMRQMKIS